MLSTSFYFSGIMCKSNQVCALCDIILKLYVSEIPYLAGYETGFSPLKNDYKHLHQSYVVLLLYEFYPSYTPKDLDLSYKMNVVFWIVLEGKNSVLQPKKYGKLITRLVMQHLLH